MRVAQLMALRTEDTDFMQGMSRIPGGKSISEPSDRRFLGS
jgi:hypothetical protein